MPMVSCFFKSMAKRNFVPTPSVPDTKIGSLYLLGIAHKAPNPPSPPITSARVVRFTSGLIRSTKALPALMSTPASL